MTEVLTNPGSPAQRRKYGAPATDVCVLCSKTVYPVEKLTADNKILHKACLKCGHCKKTLSLGNYASLNGTFYCKPHFKQLFALKGNYTDGFVASAQASASTAAGNDAERQDAPAARGADGSSPKSLADRLHAYQSEVTKAQTESKAPSRDNTRDFSGDARQGNDSSQSEEIESLRRQLEGERQQRREAEQQAKELRQQLAARSEEVERLQEQVKELKLKAEQAAEAQGRQQSRAEDDADSQNDEKEGSNEEWN